MFAYCKDNLVNMSDPIGFMATWAEWTTGVVVFAAVIAIIVLAQRVNLE